MASPQHAHQGLCVRGRRLRPPRLPSLPRDRTSTPGHLPDRPCPAIKPPARRPSPIIVTMPHPRRPRRPQQRNHPRCPQPVTQCPTPPRAGARCLFLVLAHRMKLALHWKILIGLALGTITGLLLNGKVLDARDLAVAGRRQPSSSCRAASPPPSANSRIDPNARRASPPRRPISRRADRLHRQLFLHYPLHRRPHRPLLARGRHRQPRRPATGPRRRQAIALFLFTSFTSAALGVALDHLQQASGSSSVRESLRAASPTRPKTAPLTPSRAGRWPTDAIPSTPSALPPTLRCSR